VSLPELHNYAAAMEDEPSGKRDTSRRRAADVEEKLAPPWRGEAALARAKSAERRAHLPPASPRLGRSSYEKVFLRLGSGKRLRIGSELLTPVGVKGWYHAVFRDPSGTDRLLSIDQVLEHMDGWCE
jgi:hypothetical protein